MYVPIDTSEYSNYYRDMVAKGIVNQYCLGYVDKHRKELKRRYATVADFDRNFEVTDAEMQKFIDMGTADSIKFDAKQYATSREVLSSIIKGLIARDVYTDPSAYTVIINHRNRDLKMAIEVLNDHKRYNELLKHGNPEYEAIAARRKATTKKK